MVEHKGKTHFNTILISFNSSNHNFLPCYSLLSYKLYHIIYLIIVIFIFYLKKQNYWHIRDDNHKAQVLRDCNTQWKAYKSALLKLWEKGVNPVKEYPYLDKAMWKKFIVLKSTEEFEVCLSL